MAPSNESSAHRNPVPRIRSVVIPKRLSRPPKQSSSPSAASTATIVSPTQPKVELPDNVEPAQHPEPPLTPESTPSNAHSRPGIATPTDSNSDPLPGENNPYQPLTDLHTDFSQEVSFSGPAELHADTAISSPPISDTPYTARSDTLDPLAHFVPQGGEYSVTQSTTPAYYLDAQSSGTMGYPIPVYDYHAYSSIPAFQVPYHENIHTPPGLNGAAPVFSNGTNGDKLSRSGSHSSIANDVHAPQSSPPRANRSSMSSAVNAADQSTQLESASISNYLGSKFCNPEFADYILNVTSSTSHQPMAGLPGHGIILARSPTLRYLIFSLDRQNMPNMNGLPILQVHIDDQFLSPYQLHWGLAHLYGYPLPNLDGMSYSQSSSDAMSAALGFAAVGRFLQMPHLMSHGIKFAVKHLAWDNIERTLAFHHEGNRLLTTTPYIDHETRSATTEIENELVRSVIQFLVYYFPKDFNLHTAAAELIGSPRLPAVHDSRPSISHTRLASIQFGEVSTEDSTKLDNSVLLSSILLSIPNTMLQTLFDSHVLGGKLGWAKVSQILRDTIAEREKRRIRVRKMPNKRVLPGATAGQWESVQWEEHLEADERHPTGFAIERKRVTDEAAG